MLFVITYKINDNCSIQYKLQLYFERCILMEHKSCTLPSVLGKNSNLTKALKVRWQGWCTQFSVDCRTRCDVL